MIHSMKSRLQSASIHSYVRLQSFLADNRGSDTTEKIGSILVAAIIIGIMITVVKGPMRTMFDALLTRAQELITQNATNA